eukprot:1159279-Pelagomonas_calceolata.AAC.23
MHDDPKLALSQMHAMQRSVLGSKMQTHARGRATSISFKQAPCNAQLTSSPAKFARGTCAYRASAARSLSHSPIADTLCAALLAARACHCKGGYLRRKWHTLSAVRVLKYWHLLWCGGCFQKRPDVSGRPVAKATEPDARSMCSKHLPL